MQPDDDVDVSALFRELVQFEIELWNAVDEKLREAHDLTLSRFEPLQVIARTPGCRVNDIAEALSITIGGTSKIVDRIEKAGLCQRQPDPNDGRSSLIELTHAGRQLLPEATRTFAAELELLIGSTVPLDSLAQFGATIRLLRQGLRGKKQTSAKVRMTD